MRIRLAIAVAPLLASTYGCSTEQAHGAAVSTAEALSVAERVSWIEPSVAGVLEVPAGEMRVALRTAYRLRPDRRMLMAVGEVHHLLTGRPLAPVKTTRDGDRWTIAYEGQHVGSLPATPTWEEARVLLADWGRRLTGDTSAARTAAGDGKTESAIRRRLALFTGADVIRALDDIDTRWNTRAPRDGSLLPMAAQGLVSLVLLARDRADAGDALQARALAAVTLAREQTPDASPSQPRFEALLAERMGYHAVALRIVEPLPSGDETRRFVRGEHDALRTAAFASDASPLARHLYLLTLDGSEDEAAWRSFVEHHGVDLVTNPAVAGTGLGVGSYDLDASLPTMLQEAVFAELAAQGGQRTLGDRVRATLLRSYGELGVALAELGGALHPGNALRRIDREVARAVANRRGVFADPALLAGYYRAQLYSAYLDAGYHALHGPSSPAGAVRLSRRFAGLRRDSPDAQFGEWLTHYVKADAGIMPGEVLRQDLSRFPSVSGELIDDLYDTIRNGGGTDTSHLSSTRTVLDRYDSRPSLRRYFIHAARYSLHDPVLVERYSAGIGDALQAGDPGPAMWLATTARDTSALLAIARDTTAGVDTRADALDWLARKANWSDSATAREYQIVVASTGGSWAANARYIAFLRRQEAYEAAERVARDYLAANGRAKRSDALLARVSIARTLQAQQQYDAAWREIDPWLGTSHPGALAVAIELLARRGRVAEADSIAGVAAEKYPEVHHVLAARLEVWWRRGHHAAVAATLRGSDGLSGDENVARNFTSVFGDTVERALAAVDSLVANDVGSEQLEALAWQLNQRARPDLAFIVEAGVRSSRPEVAIGTAVRAYRYLRAADGDSAALAWLRQRMGRGLDDTMAVFLHGDGHDDLLWTWDPTPQPAYSPYMWVLRAAGVARGDTASARRAELETYYREPVPELYHTIGRYLLGRETEESVLAHASSPERRCEIAYFFALKAEAEGRWRDAVEWYRVAVETRSVGDGEYRWALEALERLAEGDDGRGLR